MNNIEDLRTGESAENMSYSGPQDLISLSEASRLASEPLSKKVTPSNISYLAQYGRVKSFGLNGLDFEKNLLARL